VGFTETEGVAGVTPDDGLIVSHVAVDDTVAVYGTDCVDPIVIVCAGGFCRPTVYAKFSVDGEAVSDDGASTFSTTGTVIGLPLAPAEAITTCPAYWPGPSDPALTDTDTLAGAVPLAGVADSHVPPDGVVDAATVNGNDAGELVTAIVCAAGAGPPWSCTKLSVVVGAEIEPGETTTCTLMVAGLLPAPGEVTVIEPL
jgi:hypothetical protein